MIHLYTVFVIIPLRCLAHFIGITLYYIESAADYTIGRHRKTEYIRAGKCNQCGHCCEEIGLVIPKSMSSDHWIIRIFAWFHRHIMNFSPIGDDDHMIIYQCNYFKYNAKKQKKTCTIYPFRHRLCRTYPITPLFDRPHLRYSCGFYFIPKHAQKKQCEFMKKLPKSSGKPFSAILKQNETIEK